MKRTILGFTIVFALGASLAGQSSPAEVAPAPGKEPAPLSALSVRKNKPLNPVFTAAAVGAGTYYTPSVGGRSSGVPPVVVRFSGGDDETNAAMEEDLTVMTHVIERSLEHGIGEDAPDEKLGIRMLYSEGGRSVRAIYLDDFGALFMIKVSFPVFAPASAEPKEPAPTSATEWDKAKRDLYGANTEERSPNVAVISGGSKFDPEQVELLRKTLLQTLKSAANIRNLKPADFVAFTVFGQPANVVQVKKSRSKNSSQPNISSSADASGSRKNSAESARNEQKAQAVVIARTSDLLRSSTQGTVLSLRVKKSDVDAFASGKVDFETFAKRAEQHSYPGNGYGITSINSWSRLNTPSVLLRQNNFSPAP